MLDILTLEFQQLLWSELVARRWLFLPSCFFSFGLAVICLPSLKDLSTGRIKWKALPKQKGWRIINGQCLEVPSGSYYGLGSLPFFLEVPGICSSQVVVVFLLLLLRPGLISHLPFLQNCFFSASLPIVLFLTDRRRPHSQSKKITSALSFC